MLKINRTTGVRLTDSSLRYIISFQRKLKEEMIPDVPAPKPDDLDDIDLQL